MLEVFRLGQMLLQGRRVILGEGLDQVVLAVLGLVLEQSDDLAVVLDLVPKVLPVELLSGERL